MNYLKKILIGLNLYSILVLVGIIVSFMLNRDTGKELINLLTFWNFNIIWVYFFGGPVLFVCNVFYVLFGIFTKRYRIEWYFGGFIFLPLCLTYGVLMLLPVAV